MPSLTFRGDPYRELELPDAASDADIKRRWRELAREHHPDRAGEDAAEAARLTRRMARINAAYDLLRDAERRARYDTASSRGRGRSGNHGDRRTGASGDADPFAETSADPSRGGPPAPPPPRPVTARFDTSREFRGRDRSTSEGARPLRGQPPLSNRERSSPGDDLRASHPTGPIARREWEVRARVPSLEEARETVLEFGKFRGHTLGQVADFEPTYIDWIARTITRDRDLVVRARVLQRELDQQGVERLVRPARAGFGESGDASAG